MKLQRYELGLFWDGNENIPALLCEPDGECVKHSEALDWFLSLLQPILPPAGVKHFDPFIEKRIANAGAVNAELERLRAIIEAERGE